MAETRAITLPQWCLLGEATLPLLAMLALNLFRPDLMSAFLVDPVGYRVVAAVVLAVTLHVTIERVAFERLNLRYPPRTKGRRRRLALIAAPCILLLNLPATFAILFGPIVLAFTQVK